MTGAPFGRLMVGMRGAWLGLWAVCALVGCSEPMGPASGACSFDRDCVQTKVCVSGVCAPWVAPALDSGFVDAPDAETKDAEAVDAGSPADAGRPDAGALDSGSVPDSGPHDAGLSPDAGPADGGGEGDTGLPIDSGLAPDSGVAADSGVVPDSGAGPVAPGSYNFRRVLVSGLASNRHLVRAVVSRDDQTLLVSGRYGDLFVIDRPTEMLRGAPTLPSAGAGTVQRIEALHMEANSTHALVASTVLQSGTIVEGRLYRLELTGTAAPVQVGPSLAGVAVQALAPEPGGSLLLVGHRAIGGGYWVTVHAFDPAQASLTLLGQSFTSAGCQDGAVVADGLGGRGVAYVCGINGAEVGIRDSTGVFSRGPNTGNTAHIAGRPQGDYALAVTWSGGRLARFELGQWTLGFGAPSVGNSAWNIQFSDDGERALITGQYSNGVGTLREYRHNLFNTADLTDVSIPSFDAAPFLASSGVLLEDAAWRPRVDCGYLVGGCDSGSCTRGYLIHYRVLNGRACP